MRICKALLEFFLWIFSSLTSMKKLVFSKQDLLQWTVPARLYWDFWPVEGTTQLVTISKKWKIPSFALHRKRTWVQALLFLGPTSLGHKFQIKKGPVFRPLRDFRPVLWAYRPWAQISNHERPFSYTEISKHNNAIFFGGNKKLKHKLGIFHWRCLVF